MDKKAVCVIFGGEASEHEISCVSGTTVLNNIDRDIYDVTMIGITRGGKWLLVDNISDITDGTWTNNNKTAVILPDKCSHGIFINDGKRSYIKHIDIVFPVLHGLYGEDGTIQGILEMAGIPYVGCGVLASSAGMDKLSTKKIVDSLGIRQAEYVPVMRQELTDIEKAANKVESKLTYPVFVKPSNAGSSRGVSKASDRTELCAALKEAALYDSRILVEETIYGREIECAILQDDSGVKASGVGEILAAAEFYDYDAKYNNSESKTVINPDLPHDTVEKIREYAIDIFTVIDGSGLSRVDFFVENGSGEIVFNEINTMPGFTEISMYPMLWDAKGISKKELINKLIDSAKCRI